jgi:hypothetical protein
MMLPGFRSRWMTPFWWAAARASASGTQLHGEEVNAFRLLHGVDHHDVGMVERCQSLGFALKPLQTLLTRRDLWRKHL